MIGNPPYVVIKGGRYTGFEELQNVIQYYKSKYKFLQQQANIYVAFLELSYRLLKHSAFAGMIVPNTILTNDYCEKMRSFFSNNVSITLLYNEGKVFQNAVVEGLVLVYHKVKPQSSNLIKTKLRNIKGTVYQNIFDDLAYRSRFLIHLNKNEVKILIKIIESKNKLGNMCEVWRGLTTGDDNKYLSNKPLNENYYPIVQGKHIRRYSINDEPLFVNYLTNELDRPRPKRIFESKEKLISKFVGKRLSLAYDNKKRFVINTACIILLKKPTIESIKYILGILNSEMMEFYFQSMFTDYRDTFPIIKSGYLERLPIRPIDFSDPADESRHDKMVMLVERMLTLHKDLAAARTEHEQTALQRQIDASDRQINELVYELYELREEEIRIVERRE